MKANVRKGFWMVFWFLFIAGSMLHSSVEKELEFKILERDLAFEHFNAECGDCQVRMRRAFKQSHSPYFSIKQNVSNALSATLFAMLVVLFFTREKTKEQK